MEMALWLQELLRCCGRESQGDPDCRERAHGILPSHVSDGMW